MMFNGKIMPGKCLILFLSLILVPGISLWGEEGEGQKPFRFVAHRGASYLAPENTLASITLAWELGADAAECDVRLSSDNQVVVFHDKNTKKLTGESHVIARTPWKELQNLSVKGAKTNLPEFEGEKIPLLKELLETIPSDRMLVIEIKTGTEILPFLKGVVDRHWTTGKIAFISFDFDAIRQAKAIYSGVPCYYLSGSKSDAKKHILKAVQNNLDGLNLKHSIIDQELSMACREAGLELWCWTVNDPGKAVAMKWMGVSAVTTDRPKWLKEQILPEEEISKTMNYRRYEAESGSYRQMTELIDSSASGGACLSIEKSSVVKWEVTVDRSGYYQLEIRYRTRGGDMMQYLLKNNSEIACGFDMSANWNLFSQPFYLDSGINTLGIRDGWGNMDIDWIAVESPEFRFGITPGKNSFYKSAPYDLVFKIDNFHQEVQEVLVNGQSLDFSVYPYPFQESAIWLNIPADQFLECPEGIHKVVVKLENKLVKASISVMPEPLYSNLMIVAPDVDHGSAMILRLPSGKHMLIDCGKSWVRDSILVPMLHRHHIDTIQTFIVTHYHDDHDGGDSGVTIINDFHVERFIDYNTYATGYEWDQDGVHFKILNSFADGEEENTRSLAIKISYNGFTLVHGGDTYAMNQQKIIRRFVEDVPAQVFYANHHFHGSVDPVYIRITNPDLVILQAQEAIYGRSAYMVKYKEESEKVLNKSRNIPIETLPALEVGTIVLRIDGTGKWEYESYRDQDELVIPGYF
ncbi:MAG: glycerophosphodiester phosphodiesterase family protein [Bacteroidales bacterium]